ncbi:helix-turn-helix domain-containing protein [Hymenobacter lucidus]|uniref:Helix-turn-helix domain-containing protein n=1 Tax=Hymenobacter lucidus TaxID=2880930 RepID=A0ABS8AQW0_9BACT|nr:helix-turn-helix domain-containing protein [Hymenobacter lucidus]MCB2408124.1 helix-turn-helix domain-containing protein [Hymenobacter lucidus]
MSYAPLLRDVRAHFGLLQADLATWLGISRSLLALVETGREELPRHARPWLFPWLTAQALPDDETTVPAPPLAPALLLASAGPAAALARLRECDYQVRRLHLQHLALLGTLRTAARRLAAAPVLHAALPPETAAEPVALALRRRWLARLREAATDALLPEAEAGPVVAALLGMRGEAYRHEGVLLEAWLAGGKG